MNIEDFSLVIQLIESMQEATKELEKAIEKNNIERINKSKQEILKFQKEIAKLLI